MDVSHEMMPRIVRPDAGERLPAAMAATACPIRPRPDAALVAGQKPHALPIFQGTLPGHAFAPFRRIGQSLLYHWDQARDEAA